MARVRNQAERTRTDYRALGEQTYGHLRHATARVPWEGFDFEPIALGPTWQRTAQGLWLLPELTIGWDVLGWMHRWLQHSDETPWLCTDEQARFILWWYSLTDDGRFLFIEAVLQRIKGWGKDPLGACICAAEMLGPVRVADMDGDRIITEDIPDAWVQTAAVNFEQTKNTMRLFPTLFTDEAVATFGINIGKEKVYALNDARMIEAVTSSPRALQGNRGSATLLNETHEWVASNDGHAMKDTVADNLTKSPDAAARALSITNAYDPGEDSVGQRDREAYEQERAGRVEDLGLMYDSLEAPAEAELDAEWVEKVVLAIRGDSTWLTPERVIKRVNDIRNEPSRARRFWLNQVTAAADAVFSAQEWDQAADPDLLPAQGELITMGLDPSESDDHTVLIGNTIDTDHSFLIGRWEPGPDGLIDRAAVDLAVRKAFVEFDVVGFYSDVHPFEGEIDAWERDFMSKRPGEGLCVESSAKRPIAWDMRATGDENSGRQRLFTEATLRFTSAVLSSPISPEGQRFTHDGSRAYRWYVLNAYRRANKWGFIPRKETRDSQRKIDALPAAILARLARLEYLALPESRKRKRRTGKVW